MSKENRLKRLKNVLSLVKEMAKGLNHPMTSKISQLLLECSIIVPNKEIVEYIRKSQSNPIAVLPLVGEDRLNYPHLDGFFEILERSGASASAYYSPEIQTIVIVFKHWQSDEYLASVLMHEAIHALQDSEARNLDELATKEVAAYLVHFEIMDYIGEKNPRYKIAIREEGLWALGLYKATGKYPGLDYSEAKRIRRFFQSTTSEQDKAWYTLWWFRRNFEMFIFLNEGNLEKASEDFRMFYKDVYSNSMI